jgi:SEC-C motif
MATHKIGRNDPCPCGSGKKYKKCHLDKNEEPWQSKEFQDRAWATFDQMLEDEKRRKEQFGHVRPIIHANAWDKKIIAVGNRLYFTHPKSSFSDFLQNHLRETFGDQWWKEELAKPLIARHPVAQWQAHAEELFRGETPDERDRYLITRDGPVTAFMTLGHDLYTVRNNVKFQETIVTRLRSRDGFAGVRYELLVAAAFVRAGFEIEPEDELNPDKHPEFVATHKATKFVIAVEAKARNRRQNDMNPEKAGVDDLITKAAKQALADKPFALFVDVVMPPGDQDKPSWLDEVDQAVKAVMKKDGDKPGPFDLVLFTNFPHRYGEPGKPDPRKEWMVWQPLATRIPQDIINAIVTAVQQYGNIPEFGTGSAGHQSTSAKP